MSIQIFGIHDHTELYKYIEDTIEKAIKKHVLLISETRKEKDQFVTINEVIKELKVTKPTIYNWIKKGLIESKKIGGRALFNLEEIKRRIGEGNSQFGNGRDYVYKSKASKF